MLESWSEETPAEETETMLRELALLIQKRRLEVPAMIFFESARPVANYIAQSSLVFAPFVAPFLGGDIYGKYSSLLAKPDNIERLISLIEDGKLKSEPELKENLKQRGETTKE